MKVRYLQELVKRGKYAGVVRVHWREWKKGGGKGESVWVGRLALVMREMEEGAGVVPSWYVDEGAEALRGLVGAGGTGQRGQQHGE